MLGGMLGLFISTLAFAVADTYALLVLARTAQGVAGGASWYKVYKKALEKKKKKNFYLQHIGRSGWVYWPMFSLQGNWV
jgi:MFS family permease